MLSRGDRIRPRCFDNPKVEWRGWQAEGLAVRGVMARTATATGEEVPPAAEEEDGALAAVPITVVQKAAGVMVRGTVRTDFWAVGAREVVASMTPLGEKVLRAAEEEDGALLAVIGRRKDWPSRW